MGGPNDRRSRHELFVHGTGLWCLTPGAKVGAIVAAGVEVHVAPKLPIDRVVYLLESTTTGLRWRDHDRVEVGDAPDLLRAVVEVFTTVSAQALRYGLIQGYRGVEESLLTVRGRIREADQLRRRYGQPLPVEVRYDDYTVDTPENRLLRAAVRTARRLPSLPTDLRTRLTRLDADLAGVHVVTQARALEPWRATRLNARLHHALHLADLIITGASFDLPSHGLTANGFVINLAKVFEDFVCHQLGRRLHAHGGHTTTQYQTHLDTEHTVAMRPDLVWLDDTGTPAAVIDAKYKAEKANGYPDADHYQMLAYCTALDLPTGHLIYAHGHGPPRCCHVRGGGPAIHATALDLRLAPTELADQLDQLASRILPSSVLSI